ncbi:MAG: hemolysin family protein [Acidimicrobiales bacterium]
MSWFWAVFLFLFAVGVSAVVGMIETSLVRLGAVGGRAFEDLPSDRSEALEDLLDNPERLLAPLLFIRVIVQVVAIATLGVVAGDRLEPAGLVVVLALGALLLYLFGEVVPRVETLTDSEKVLKKLVRPALAIARMPVLGATSRGLLRGMRRILPGVVAETRPLLSEEDMLSLAEAAAEADVIEDEERSLIESVFEFGDTVVREVMVPRTDMVTITADSTIDSVLREVVDNGFTRFPVCGDGVDDIVGVVLSKDLLRLHLQGKGPATIQEVLREAPFVPETKRVAQLMPEMQASKFHLAVVVDEYGGTAGLVTLEDLLEELVGEIIDEFDDEDPLVATLADGRTQISARMPADDFAEFVGLELPEGDWDTVGGLFSGVLGHIPEQGESVEVMGIVLSAVEVEGNRIDQIAVGPLAGQAEAS